jgi:hypothetical protein
MANGVTVTPLYHHHHHHHHHHIHHHHLPPWISSFPASTLCYFLWDVHDLFSLEVCSWGRVSAVWCCTFFQDGWSSFVLCLVLTSYIPEIISYFLMTSLLILSSLVYPLTVLRKRICAASRRLMSRLLPHFINIKIVFFKMPPHVPYGLHGFPSRLWPKCNRLLRLGRPWGAVTLSWWGGWWYMNVKYQEGP